MIQPSAASATREVAPSTEEGGDPGASSGAEDQFYSAIEINKDGTITVQVQHPYQPTRKNGCDVPTEGPPDITIRQTYAEDLEVFDDHKGLRAYRAMASRLSGVDEEVLAKMDLRDYSKVRLVVGGRIGEQVEMGKY